MSAYRIALTLLLFSLVAPACSFNDAGDAPNTTPGWNLGGEDQGLDQPATLDMPPPGPDATPTLPVDPDSGPDQPGQDMAPDQPPTQPDMQPPTPDMQPPEPDMQPPEPDMPSGGDLGEDDPCVRTAECSGSLQCCPDLSGLNLCKAQSACFTGGVCLVDQECPGNQQCCDFSQFGLPQKICRDSCMIGGGPGGPGNPMPTPGCAHNGECAQNEVCCPSFSGATSCTLVGQCATGGGTCTQESHCGPNLQCCRFGQIASGLCLNRCGI